MSVFDVGFKFNLEKPWLTEGERGVFRRLRARAEVSSFRVLTCAGVVEGEGACPNEVPDARDDETGELLKRFCSKACYDSIEENDDAEDDDEGDW